MSIPHNKKVVLKWEIIYKQKNGKVVNAFFEIH